MSVFVQRSEPTVFVQRDAERVYASAQPSAVVLASTMGARGPAGPSGAEAGSNIEIPFAFGDASPLSIGTAPGVAVAVSLVITEAFNGVGAALSVGLSGTPEALMAAAQSAPGETGRYEANPAFAIGNQPLFLFITPGLGATQGAGVLYLEIAT